MFSDTTLRFPSSSRTKTNLVESTRTYGSGRYRAGTDDIPKGSFAHPISYPVKRPPAPQVRVAVAASPTSRLPWPSENRSLR